MKIRFLAAVALALGVNGCGGAAPSGIGVSQPALEQGHTIDSSIPCGVDQPGCPAGTFCGTADLQSGPIGPACLPNAICDSLHCASGSCTIAESFPAQVSCASGGGAARTTGM